jgi:Ca2+-binding EF-hand superfamily protein
MFSQTERDLKEIAFKFFDTNGDGRLSERDMFELMQ